MKEKDPRGVERRQVVLGTSGGAIGGLIAGIGIGGGLTTIPILHAISSPEQALLIGGFGLLNALASGLVTWKFIPRDRKQTRER